MSYRTGKYIHTHARTALTFERIYLFRSAIDCRTKQSLHLISHTHTHFCLCFCFCLSVSVSLLLRRRLLLLSLSKWRLTYGSVVNCSSAFVVVFSRRVSSFFLYQSDCDRLAVAEEPRMEVLRQSSRRYGQFFAGVFWPVCVRHVDSSASVADGGCWLVHC